ncbi:MAG: methyltransferase domain-containing protein [Actinobacteria bacterium]|nr:methyltransferase domain-containing protein [Actinomycetota bacterium]
MIASHLWREKLESWAIPLEIIDQAPESPWIHPPALFQVPKIIEMSPSHDKAFRALPDNGSFLDIGCGGGIAAFAMGKKAGRVIGIDHQRQILEMFSENSQVRNIDSVVHEGFWPAIANEVEVADVVAAHHVVYNVLDIVPFISAMNTHARKRVVIEMPQNHPLSNLNSAWKHFWDLERPIKPTPKDLLNVLNEMGISARLELWEGQMRADRDLEQAVEFTRIRLCLPRSRDGEVRDFLISNPQPETRKLATIWWDVVD